MCAKMVDITKKPIVYREATAIGKIRLKEKTIELIKKQLIEKGDVINISKVVGIIGAKRTSDLLPFCHPIPITNVSIDIKIDEKESCLVVESTVKTTAQTGVEMEALTSVALALLNVWDMVKKYEKDKKGQYPTTKIYDIRVVSKIKKEL